MTDRCENCIHVQMCKWADEMVANHTCDWYREESPKGKWIVREDLGGRIQCDNCGCFSGLTSEDVNNGWKLNHYCSKCGADMRVKNELNRVKNELNNGNTTLLYSITNGDNFIGKKGEEK